MSHGAKVCSVLYRQQAPLSFEANFEAKSESNSYFGASVASWEGVEEFQPLPFPWQSHDSMQVDEAAHGANQRFVRIVSIR